MPAGKGERPESEAALRGATPLTPEEETTLGAPGAAMTGGLDAGERLAGRYVIKRRLGRGGMGEVYEVEDLALHVRVALKIVRPEIAADPSAMARFRREIQLARKVTHPNVCRVFDIGFDRREAARGGAGVTFLTMELLEGRTLSERIEQFGRLSTLEALPLVGQMAAALDAAHRAGVVHRDFKSGNVLLVATESETRAVVADFGLARGPIAAEHSALSHSEQGLLGTPAFMAPEQVSGGPVLPAADLYALGVVMYQMVTGRLPFLAATALGTATKRLTEAPPSPRALVPELDERWERTILRCLEREPTKRFGSGADVVAGLGGGRVRRGGRAVGAGAALAILVAGGGLVIARYPSPPAEAPPVGRRSVAVVSLKNASGRAETAWLATAFSEMLTTELATAEKLRTVPGGDVAQARLDLAIGDTDHLDRETLGKLRHNLGVDLVVAGSFLTLGKAGGSLRLDLLLQDTATGTALASIVESGEATDIVQVASRAGRRLRKRLAGAEASSPALDPGRASLPRSVAAARDYAEGLAKLRSFDALGARTRLANSIAAEGDFPLAHAALAQALTVLGEEDNARTAAKRAFELSTRLRREERLLVEARWRLANQEWDRATDLWRTLWEFFPDRIDHGLGLAEAQWSAGQAQDALATIEELRRLPPPSGDDARIDLAEAQAAEASGDFRRDQEAARRAMARGRARGQQLVVAQALGHQAFAAHNLGDFDGCVAHAEEQGRIAAGFRFRYLEGDALTWLQMCRYRQGQLPQSLAAAQRALAVYREIGNRGDVLTAQVNLAHIHLLAGSLDPARRVLEDAWQRVAEAALPRRAHLTTEIGTLALRRGDLGVAGSRFEDALAMTRQMGEGRNEAWVVALQGEVLLLRDDLGGARRKLEEALAIREQLGFEHFVAESRLLLARLALAEGHPGAAAPLARRALEAFQRHKASDAEAETRAVLAEALLAERKLAEARGVIAPAAAWAANTGFAEARLVVAIADARVRAADGEDRTAVARSLAATAAEAARLGFIGRALEARLALGELEGARGRARLAALAHEARAREFFLITRRAAARSTRPGSTLLR